MHSKLLELRKEMGVRFAVISSSIGPLWQGSLSEEGQSRRRQQNSHSSWDGRLTPLILLILRRAAIPLVKISLSTC